MTKTLKFWTFFEPPFRHDNEIALAKIEDFEADPVKLFPFPVDFVRKTLKISNFLLRNRVKPWKFQTKTKFHQKKKAKFSKLFANLLRWSLENFEKSADSGPLPAAEIELLPVEIYKVYKQI